MRSQYYSLFDTNNISSIYKKNVITFGTFDLFHKGHYNILKRAKDLGNKLIVGVSSDWLNLTKKGIESIDSQEKRITNIKNLDFVDEVFLEESLEDKPKYIKLYYADILVMGDDWENKFDNLGIKTKYFPRTPNISSTLLKKINYNDKPFTLKNKLKLNGTYKVPLANTSDIFPLKKYKFYNYELWGPKSYQVMEDFYSSKCPMMTHAYAKWKKPPKAFKLLNFKPANYKYTNKTDEDFNKDGVFCTTHTKSCVHNKKINTYVGEENDMQIRQCCRNKLNNILIDICQFLEQNKIPYFIYWGTLLGAIRHGGSIPWDTDNDLYILDIHFDKLLDILFKSDIYKKNYFSKVNKKFIRCNFSRNNKVHLDIYVADQIN